MFVIYEEGSDYDWHSYNSLGYTETEDEAKMVVELLEEEKKIFFSKIAKNQDTMGIWRVNFYTKDKTVNFQKLKESIHNGEYDKFRIEQEEKTAKLYEKLCPTMFKIFGVIYDNSYPDASDFGYSKIQRIVL